MASIICVLALNACASEEETFEPEDPGDTPIQVLPCPSDVPGTEIGMTVDGAGDTLRAELVDADDVPARKGLNNWVIKLTDIDGETLDDVELEASDIKGMMPGHPHGLNHDPLVESLGDGTFEVHEINLLMDGEWNLTFSPTSESLGSDDITFNLCTSASIAAADDEP